MKRRAYLAAGACSLGILSGCLGFGESEDYSVQVKNTSLTIDERVCDESGAHGGSVSVTDGEISVSGTFKTNQQCPSLRLATKVGVDPQADGALDIELVELEDGEGECLSCEPILNYSVSVTTDEQPTQANVQHFPLSNRVYEVAVWTAPEA
jgi:hypothetical protein